VERFSGSRSIAGDTGCFLQQDPLDSRPGEMNGYVYVANNPLNLLDPSGMSAAGPCECIDVFTDCMSKSFLGIGKEELDKLLEELSEIGQFYWTSRAWEHAGDRGLVWFRKSSIFRKYIRRAAALEFFSAAMLVKSVIGCLREENECLKPYY
jgi:hypothetical protein